MLGSRTNLNIIDAGSVNGTRYCNEILLPYVRLFKGATGLQFLFMDDNVPCHRTVAAEQLLERLGARTLPPVTILELLLALQDEWAAMPQQLIDTLILSMGRRCETCLAISDDDSCYTSLSKLTHHINVKILSLGRCNVRCPVHVRSTVKPWPKHTLDTSLQNVLDGKKYINYESVQVAVEELFVSKSDDLFFRDARTPVDSCILTKDGFHRPFDSCVDERMKGNINSVYTAIYKYIQRENALLLFIQLALFIDSSKTLTDILPCLVGLHNYQISINLRIHGMKSNGASDT
ncbi:transposable element Tcb1 transposase [Trichonephila clavipes]|nr:transposable element Tcb1 transposase [Trichonephila clavipes]